MSKIAKAYEALNGDLSNCWLYMRGVEKFVYWRESSKDYACYPNTHASSLHQYICTVKEFNNYKPQKTVVDAVIYYGGSNFVSGKHEKHHTHIIRRGVTREYCTAYSSDIPAGNAVCTIKYYNQCIEDMSTNYGRSPQTYAEYKNDYGSIQLSAEREKEAKVEYLIGKEMSLDGWSEIKGSYGDGITYRCVSGDNPNDPDAVFITGREYTANGTGVVDEYDKGSKTSICVTGSSILKLISMPKHNPTYTKAMSDAGELPSNGMKCTAYIYAETSNQGNPANSWVDGEFIEKCKAPNGGFCCVFKAGDGVNHVINATSHFRELDTRTDKEKTIDEIYNAVYANKTINDSVRDGHDDSIIEAVLSVAYDNWVSQPLTVADK